MRAVQRDHQGTAGPDRARQSRRPGRTARAGGIVGVAAAALLVITPGALADERPGRPGAPSGKDEKTTLRPSGEKTGGPADPGEAGAREDAGGQEGRPGQPVPGAPEPVAPEAKGRIEAGLVRGPERVRAGATLNYRLDLDVRGTVSAVTVDLEANLGVWLLADIGRARGAARPDAGLACATEETRVRCSADELTSGRNVKLKLRLPKHISADELKVAGRVGADGEADAFADVAAVTKDEKTDGKHGKDGHGDHDGNAGRADRPKGTAPGAVRPALPAPLLPEVRTVNVASLPLDDSPPKLPEVGPAPQAGVAPQRPAPAAVPRAARAAAGPESGRGDMPDGAAIALGLGGLAVMLAGGLYGHSALRKD